MATVYFRGDTPATSDVWTITPGGTIGTETFTVTINGKSITYTATGGDAVADVVDGLVAAWNASTTTELTEYDATDSTTHMTLTADTAGVPGTISSSATGSATNVAANTTAATGPNFWSEANNWSGGAVPVNSDTVILENSDVDILYGLDQSAVTLTLFDVRESYIGDIGLPQRNTAGYLEYRDTELQIGATNFLMSGGGSRTQIDLGSASNTTDIRNTGQRSDQNYPAMTVRGTSISQLSVYRGDVGVALLASETATITTLDVGFIEAPDSDVVLSLGSGVGTLTTFNQSGGDVYCQSNITTMNADGGILTLDKTATIGTYNGDGGIVYYQSTGTLTTANIGSDAVLDFSRDLGSRTVSDCHVSRDATINDPFKTVTWSAGINLFRCGVQDVTLNIGEHLRVTPGAYS